MNCRDSYLTQDVLGDSLLLGVADKPGIGPLIELLEDYRSITCKIYLAKSTLFPSLSSSRPP